MKLWVCPDCGVVETHNNSVNWTTHTHDGKEVQLNPAPATISVPVPDGAWIVYGLDTMAYPLFLSMNELEARRWAGNNGYGIVKFWAFGTDWSTP